jgi:hypothetical protein
MPPDQRHKQALDDAGWAPDEGPVDEFVVAHFKRAARAERPPHVTLMAGGLRALALAAAVLGIGIGLYGWSQGLPNPLTSALGLLGTAASTYLLSLRIPR